MVQMFVLRPLPPGRGVSLQIARRQARLPYASAPEVPGSALLSEEAATVVLARRSVLGRERVIAEAGAAAEPPRGGQR